MSLVNKLLQDLEGRKNKAIPNDDIPAGLQSVQSSPSKRLIAGRGLYYLLSLLVIAVVLFILYWPKTKTKQPIAKAPVIKPLKEMTSLPPEKKAPAKAKSANKELVAKVPKLLEKPVKAELTSLPVTKIVPPHEPVKKKIVQILTPTQKAQKQYNQALVLLNEGKGLKAQALLKQILKTRPKMVDARVSLVALMHQLKPADAFKILNKGLALTPSEPKLVVAKAQLQVSLDLPKEALKTLLTISPSIEKHADYYEMLGAIHQRLGEFKMAAQAYRSLIEAYPHEGKYWLGIAIAFNGMEMPNAAKRAFKEAIQTGSLNPNMKMFARSKIHELGGA